MSKAKTAKMAYQDQRCIPVITYTLYRQMCIYGFGIFWDAKVNTFGDPQDLQISAELLWDKLRVYQKKKKQLSQSWLKYTPQILGFHPEYGSIYP